MREQARTVTHWHSLESDKRAGKVALYFDSKTRSVVLQLICRSPTGDCPAADASEGRLCLRERLSLVGRHHRQMLMPDVLRCGGVNGVFRHVGGVIADAFETARNENQIQVAAELGRIFRHPFDQAP